MYERLIHIGFIGIACLMVFANSCVYNSEEDLYPPTVCDTTIQVTYAATIEPIIEFNCYDCHGASAPSSGIPLEGYVNIIKKVQDSTLIGAIHHWEGFTPMPQTPDGASMLPDCDIWKIDKWVSEGAMDN